MSVLQLFANSRALGVGRSTSFGAQGGTAPYTYSVAVNGAGGSIDGSGTYTAPAVVNPDPAKSYDTVIVTDAVAATASLTVLVADVLGLFCEIIQSQLSLAIGRVYFWNQKIFEPTDSGLFVAVSMITCKPFGNTNTFVNGDSVQSINMMATLQLDIISRSTEALTRKEEVLMALASTYSEQQQEANSFNIARLPDGARFVNLSSIDGAAIPYRYNIPINIQYFVRKTQAVAYFDQFDVPTVTTES